MGFVDEPGLLAVDGLMRQVFGHARQVEHVRSAALDRYLRGAADAPALDPTPAGVLRALASVATTGGAPPAVALDAIDAASVASPVEWTEDVRVAFSELLRTGDVRPFQTLDRWMGRAGRRTSGPGPSAIPTTATRSTCTCSRPSRGWRGCCGTRARTGWPPGPSRRWGTARPFCSVPCCTTSVRGARETTSPRERGSRARSWSGWASRRRPRTSCC
jgi:hypothetical protein